MNPCTSALKYAQVQASPDKWITVVTMTAAVQRFVLNCLYTLVKYGKQPHYIVVTFDPVSHITCKFLNLPCFDGQAFNTGDQVTLYLIYRFQCNL